MSNVKKKTYDDTFLFSLPGEMMKHHNHISDFIVRSNRVDNKRADNFRGVVEDIRRYQKSSVIYHVLMRDDVVLCINEVEMPAAFKVFIAKDPKANGAKKVFIDVTGIIDFKNGAYYCKNVQRLITYLLQAITWLLYEYEPESILNNSNVTLSATDCFVKIFDYILGYFRFNGFAENRIKIDYLAALYFMVNILGKDDDQYTHQVAAKLAGLDQGLTKSYSLYYEKEDLANINNFITLLANTFKLKGLNTEVFISRWMTNCGNGTQFAPELFTAFSNMLLAAYVGAYIVNQKSIDKLCSSSMTKYGNAILKLGADELDRGKVFESLVNTEDDHIVSLLTEQTKSLLEAKSTIPQNIKFTKEDCKSRKVAECRVKLMVKHYTQADQCDKLADKVASAVKLALKAMDTNKVTDSYDEGVLTAIIKPAAKYLRGSVAGKSLKSALEDGIGAVRENIEKQRNKDNVDRELTKKLGYQMKEIMYCRSLI